ncbi:MAG: type II secretion system protein N [Maricaulaceae bacterium]
MARWSWHIAVFVAVVVIAASATLPMGAALALADARGRGFDYAGAAGTIWGGAVYDARLGGLRFDRIAALTDRRAMLAGRLRARVIAEGGVAAGTGVVDRSLWGEAWSMEAAQFTLSLDQLPGLAPRFRAPGAQLEVSMDRVRFENGACVLAEGRGRTDWLARGPASGVWLGPDLSGPWVCEDGQLMLKLVGRSQDGQTVRADLSPSGNGATLRVALTGASPSQGAAARLVGFEDAGPDQLVLRTTVVFASG